MNTLARVLNRSLLPFAIAATLLVAGCGEEDATSLRITLNADQSGEVLTSAIALPETPGPIEAASSGADWNARAAVHVARGKFASIDALKLADLGFEVIDAPSKGSGSSAQRLLVVTLPRGPEARWLRLLTIPQGDVRQRATAALDPAAKSRASRYGTVAKIEITLPGPVISNGFQGKVRGATSAADDRVATLMVPVEAAFETGEPIRWHLSWSK
jgi:hypothetical protein